MKHTLLIFGLLWALGASGQIYIDSYRFGGGAPPATLLLDDYPNAAAAYSLRLLRTAYTGNCIEVRRVSDGATSNIGFSGGVIDTAALKTFCASTNCFVRTWYDQSTNTRNAQQTTTADQPQIVTNGAIIYQSGAPAILFDGTTDWLDITDFNLTGAHYQAAVASRSAAGRHITPIAGGSSGYALALWNDNRYYFNGRSTGYQQSSSLDSSTGRLLLSGLFDTSVLSIYKNGSALTSTFVAQTLTMSIVQLGRYSNIAHMNGTIQEAIIWTSNQSTTRANIESNINSFYNIY